MPEVADSADDDAAGDGATMGGSVATIESSARRGDIAYERWQRTHAAAARSTSTQKGAVYAPVASRRYPVTATPRNEPRYCATRRKDCSRANPSRAPKSFAARDCTSVSEAP